MILIKQIILIIVSRGRVVKLIRRLVIAVDLKLKTNMLVKPAITFLALIIIEDTMHVLLVHQ